jgi:thioredoxin reductase
MKDVIIVGGGPAGLSAALVLGRCRRSVVLFDHGLYRNARARAVHGFLTRDGMAPTELRRKAHAELAQYPSIQVRKLEVRHARVVQGRFEVEASDGSLLHARKLVLATGLTDELPALLGIEERIGISAFHCPYCDGWELRDQPLFAYGHGNAGARFALELTIWSRDVMLCTDGHELPSPELRAQLQRHGVNLRSDPIERVEGDDSRLRLLFRDGTSLERRALFYSVGCRPASHLAEQLGARMTREGGVETDRHEATNVPGLYVAGDASRDALQAIVAAGEGSAAAVAINLALTAEDLWSD